MIQIVALRMEYAHALGLGINIRQVQREMQGDFSYDGRNERHEYYRGGG